LLLPHSGQVKVLSSSAIVNAFENGAPERS